MSMNCGKHWENRGLLPLVLGSVFSRRAEVGNIFVEEIQNERKTTGERNPNQQENEPLVSSCSASLCRSSLPDC
jgi:hypothetical protein